MNWARRNEDDPAPGGASSPPPVQAADSRLSCMETSRRVKRSVSHPAFRIIVVIAAAFATCACPVPLRAATLSHAGEMIGELQQYKIRDKDSLIEIARKFGLGFNAIVDANPGVDPFIPKAGTVITVPTAWILPAVSFRPSIVINIPEYRLYYFPKVPSDTVLTFPLGIGDEGNDTPVGSYTVVEKIVKPAWNVPKSMRTRASGLPRVVPPGPRNPLGSHALRLSLRSILIHGTNRPWGIGRRSSHGCLRLYPEDIVRLYKMVPKGTRVIILNQPVKVVGREKMVFVEAHRYDDYEFDVGQAMHLLADRNLLGRTDFAKLIRAMEEKRGVPVDVTLTPGAENSLPESAKLHDDAATPDP